jgi:uncharacterized membrane protein YvbJ
MLTQSQTFPCPKCGEIINDSMQSCRFCSAPIDSQAAAAAAELQNRVNRTYSDANFLRTAAAAMFVFLALSIVPFVMMLTYLGFIITFIVCLYYSFAGKYNLGGSRQTTRTTSVQSVRAPSPQSCGWLRFRS